MNKEDLTQNQLKEYLTYNPNTGVFTWFIAPSRRIKINTIVNSITYDGYLRVKLMGNNYLLHRLAFLYMVGGFPPAMVDHINRIKTDNRWINLRHSNASENGKNRNQNKNNKSGVIWQSPIKVNQYMYYLGSYTDIFEAICARKSAENRYKFTNG